MTTVIPKKHNHHRSVVGYYHMKDSKEYFGAVYHICIINYIADTLCYDALDAIEKDKKLYRFKVKLAVEKVRQLIKKYEVKEDSFLSREFNVKLCYMSDHIQEQLQNLIDKTLEAIKEALGDIKNVDIFSQAVLALIMEQFAFYNCRDRIDEFKADNSVIVLLRDWATHEDVHSKMNDLCELLHIPDISKNMKLTSRFIRLQRQFFDCDWLAENINVALDNCKE